MTKDDVAKATLERLVQVMRPMDGARVLEVNERGFTLRLERVEAAGNLGRVGTTHLHVSAAPHRDWDVSTEPVLEAVVAEDDDFVYAGSGALGAYDDEGRGGEFDVQVHAVPKAARDSLVAALVDDHRRRVAAVEEPRPRTNRQRAMEGILRALREQGPLLPAHPQPDDWEEPRTLYKRWVVDPFTSERREMYFDASGMAVFGPTRGDVVVDETRSEPNQEH